MSIEKFRVSTVITTKSLMQRVLDTANFTPMQADIFIELCKETYNNEGIALHLRLDPHRYHAEKKIVIDKVKAALRELGLA